MRIITCKSTYFESGAEGIRTPDLRRAKAKGYVLAHPGEPGYFAVLQVFYRIAGGVSSIAYGPVLARLQYCCSTQASFTRDQRCGFPRRRYRVPSSSLTFGPGTLEERRTASSAVSFTGAPNSEATSRPPVSPSLRAGGAPQRPGIRLEPASVIARDLLRKEVAGKRWFGSCRHGGREA